jgi:hypothetical protein
VKSATTISGDADRNVVAHAVMGMGPDPRFGLVGQHRRSKEGLTMAAKKKGTKKKATKKKARKK